MTSPSAAPQPLPPIPHGSVPPQPQIDWLTGETHRLLDQAAASVITGGGFGWLDDAGEPDLARGVQLWINCRMTHIFCLGTLIGRAGDGRLADHGVAALSGFLRDAEQDGWWAQVDAVDHAPSTTDKTAYEHAFVLLAASSAVVAGRPGANELLTAAAAVVDRHFWDNEAGASVEQWNRAWTTLDGYRGANANMHSIEAYLAVSDATGDPKWRHRALRIADRLVNREARAHDWRLPEHFDARWQLDPEYNRDQPDHPFRPYGVTPGHGLEWARLMLHLDAALRAERYEAGVRDGGDGRDVSDEDVDWLVPAAIALFDRAVLDGWYAEVGGFAYTTDWDGTPVVERRFHWVVAEAIGAAAALERATGDSRFADWYAVFWEYARHVLIEPAGTGWLHEVDEEGNPVGVTWPGRADWYHAVQATLIPRLPLTPSLATALARGESSLDRRRITCGGHDASASATFHRQSR
jgi:sulfoquinovose isomerase